MKCGLGSFPAPVVAWPLHERRRSTHLIPGADMVDWYAHCTRVLALSNADLGFAEGHGLLCGRICSGEKGDVESWISEVLGAEAEGDLDRCEQVLRAVSDETLAQLRSAEFGFRPFLPDDDQSLALRCSELARWCEGFLYGLGASGRLDFEHLGDDAREVLADLSAFTTLGASDGPEDVERDFCELVEYLRVGVMFIHEELSRRQQAGAEARPRSELPPERSRSIPEAP